MADFNGYRGLTIDSSISSYTHDDTPKNRPNVVYIVLDDVGFAQLGCYGSTINTPNIDRLAASGLRYNNFHTTAICSAARASLLTGANHHTVGIASVTDNADGSFPNRQGYLSPAYATTAEVLREFGYTSFAVGKWHLTPGSEMTDAGPYTNWPLQKGFDKFYGFLECMTDQYNPNLVQDTERIRPPKTAAEGYHLSEDIADKAIKYVNKQHTVHPDKPFFLYLAFGAAHSPHQAPKEYIDRYRGKFDEGWDVLREQWFENQKRLGIIPPEAQLSERNSYIKAWDSLTDDERKVYARFMEVFAGFLEHTDAQIGKVIDHLDELGIRDNTVIVLLSDNGASAEGGLNGRINQDEFITLLEENDNVKRTLPYLDELGSSEYHNPHYPAGWANLGNTPFEWYKTWVYSGGIKDPLIVSYPGGISSKGEIRSQYLHVTDITPTILDILGEKKPDIIRGVPQQAYHGTSFAHTFDNAEAPTGKHIQYFEMVGNRGLWHDGWRAVSSHKVADDYSNDVWHLYHSDEDYSEVNDLAQEYPEKLEKLKQLWFAEAGKYGVFPLGDGSFVERTREQFGVFSKGKFFSEAQHIEYEHIKYPLYLPNSVIFNHRNSKLTFEFEYKDGYEGIIFSVGDRFNGYAVYVKNKKVHYVYNCHQEAYYKAESEPLTEGIVNAHVKFILNSDASASVKLYVNGIQEGETRIERFIFPTKIHATLKDGATTEVADDYSLPFEYPSEIRRAVFDAAPMTVSEEAYLAEFFEID